MSNMKCLILLFVWCIFFIRGLFFLDPDFGFHLRMGQMIMEQGIPLTDPFSYTMSGFPDIDEAWLLDVGIALLYPHVGMGGLVILFSFLTLGSLLIVQDIAQSGNAREGAHHIVLLLCSSVLLVFSGVRPQVISWFFLAVVLRIILDPHWNRYGRFFLPLIFVLWSNLHGGFVAGLVTMGVVLVLNAVPYGYMFFLRSLRLKKSGTFFLQQRKAVSPSGILIDGVLLVLCILSTSVNPYGWRIYDDVGVVVTSSTARWTIAEWYPTILALDLTMGMLFAFSLFFVYHYWRTIHYQLLILYAGYFLAALSSLRNVPIWILTAYPATGIALQRMWEIVRSNPWGKRRYVQAERFLLMASLAVFVSQGILIIGRSGSSYLRGAYPVDAVRYLQKFPSSGRLFSDYGWGGYLIWHLPEKKTFVDGRMALWVQASALPGETENAFHDYLDITNQKKPIQPAIEKYEINTVLLPVEEEEKKGIFNDLAMLLRKYFAKKTPSVGKLPSIEKQLVQSGWRKVYQDQTAVILRK